MIGERNSEDFTRSLDRLIGSGVDFRHGRVTRIDPRKNQVSADVQTLGSDALVVTLGAECAREAIPGLPDAGLNLYTMECATAIEILKKRYAKGEINRKIFNK